MRLIPALDLVRGRVVRLERGELARERRYAEPPELWLERFAAAGAQIVHLVDLDAACDREFDAQGGGSPLLGLLGRGVALQVAGGVRTLSAAERWLELGAERVVVGSAAAERPEEVATWIDALGPERIVVALDVRRRADGGRSVATRGWREDSGRELDAVVARLRAGGLRHALATAIERDGTLTGPDLELYRLATALAPEVAWLASGGVRSRADLAALADAGAAETVVGRALLEARIPLTEIAKWSPNGSCPASISPAAES